MCVAPWLAAGPLVAGEPPAINPFGPRPTTGREDAIPGYVELSDGTIHPGSVYLTRDKRLEINDQQVQRQREVPLRVVKQIECRVKREWMEREWKFKELASDEKMYTGGTYPAREYMHQITLQDDRKITGELSAIVYVQPLMSSSAGETAGPSAPAEPEKFLLHKRDKGAVDDKLESLVYVRFVRLGEDALAEGNKRLEERKAKKR
jgi:hypothetical protein